MTLLQLLIICLVYAFDLPGGSDGKASACNAGVRVWSLGWEDPLQKEMAAYSSTLAWKISWSEESCRLQFMGLQRVGHDWTTSLTHSLMLLNKVKIWREKQIFFFKSKFSVFNICLLLLFFCLSLIIGYYIALKHTV